LNFERFTIILMTAYLTWRGVDQPVLMRARAPMAQTCRAMNRCLRLGGFEQDDGLGQFRIGFCVWDRSGDPGIVFSLRVQAQIL
jgi:hypothetical protein